MNIAMARATMKEELDYYSPKQRMFAIDVLTWDDNTYPRNDIPVHSILNVEAINKCNSHCDHELHQ